MNGWSFIDGGGTKTEVVAYTLSGTPITFIVEVGTSLADVAVEMYDSVNTVYELLKENIIK